MKKIMLLFLVLQCALSHAMTNEEVRWKKREALQRIDERNIRRALVARDMADDIKGLKKNIITVASSLLATVGCFFAGRQSVRYFYTGILGEQCADVTCIPSTDAKAFCYGLLCGLTTCVGCLLACDNCRRYNKHKKRYHEI